MPPLLPILQALLPLSLFTLSGVALCLATWIIPLILLPSTNSRSKIHQFNETVRRGATYLQPSSRILAALLILVTILTYLHPNAAAAAKWKYYFASGLLLVQTAWWEIVFIFPINDEIAEMEELFESEMEVMLGEKDRKHLDELAVKWRKWHWGRIIIPFVGGCITLAALI